MGILVCAALIFLCCLVIWRACDGFEVASEYLGRNLSEGVRGGTINAISSSIPELLTTTIGLMILSDEEGFAIGLGTTAGSAIFNGMVIPALCILSVVGTVVAGKRVDSVLVSTKVIWRDGLSLLFCEAMLILILSGGNLQWWHGLILIALYFVYLSYMIFSMKSKVVETNSDEDVNSEIVEKIKSDLENDDVGRGVFFWLSGGPLLDLEDFFAGSEQEARMEKGEWNAWPLLIASTSVIGAACFLLVKACEWLGTGSEQNPGFNFLGIEMSGLGMPTLLVAVVFASMATSVPDTVISIRDARDGDYDDAVANALGSNIFDICFALGFPLLCYSLVRGPIEIAEDAANQGSALRMALFVLSVLAFLVFLCGKRQIQDGIRVVSMGKVKACILMSMYAVFLIYIVGLSVDHPVALRIYEALCGVAASLNLQY